MKRLIGLILILACVGIWTPAHAADISITFKGSAIDDAYLASNGILNNYGAVQQGGATRTVVVIGPTYSNRNTGVFRAIGLDDSLDAHLAVADSGWMDLRLQSIIWNDTTGLAGWFVIRATAIEAAMDWIHGNKNAAAAECECCYDSAVALGVGSCTGIDWTGCTVAADTVGFRSGLADSALVTRDTLAGHTIRLKFYGADIENMRAAGANNGWAVLCSSKPGNISARINVYGSECTMAGYADSIDVIGVWAHTTGEAPSVGRRRVASGQIGYFHPDINPPIYVEHPDVGCCYQIDRVPFDWEAGR